MDVGEEKEKPIFIDMAIPQVEQFHFVCGIMSLNLKKVITWYRSLGGGFTWGAVWVKWHTTPNKREKSYNTSDIKNGLRLVINNDLDDYDFRTKVGKRPSREN